MSGRNSSAGWRSAGNPFETMAKAVMMVAAALMMIVAFAPTSAAQVNTGPSFVSPAPNGLLGGDTVVVTMDLAGLDIASSWMWAGSEPMASDYDAVHMASNTSAVISDLPTDGSPVVFTYFYLEVDSTWKTIEAFFETVEAPFMLSPEEESFVFGNSITVEIVDAHPNVESSWIVVRDTPDGSGVAGSLGALHLGATSTPTVTANVDVNLNTDAFFIFVTYHYRVNGYWYSIQNGVINSPPIFT